MSETSLTSAAAFVEGGIQDACDDSCSICLEDFTESDPATVTGCKHEFHLQCILEWCQRSSQCPMCLQSISLKDPSSQELLDAVEHERNIRMNPPRNTAIFHHPTLGDFELQHLPVNATETELEERIIQHLAAAAAAVGRARHLARREGQRGRLSSQGRQHFLLFSAHPSGPAAAGSSPNQRSGTGPAPGVMIAGPNSPFISGGEDSGLVSMPSPVQVNQASSPGLVSTAAANRHGTSSGTRGSPTQTSPSSQERAGPSDIHSFSESLKSRFSALSLRYKESITKSTRGLRERFSRNGSMPVSGPEARREVAAPSRTIGHLDTTAESRTANASVSNNLADSFPSQQADQRIMETSGNHSLTEDTVQAPCAASSASN